MQSKEFTSDLVLLESSPFHADVPARIRARSFGAKPAVSSLVATVLHVTANYECEPLLG